MEETKSHDIFLVKVIETRYYVCFSCMFMVLQSGIAPDTKCEFCDRNHVCLTLHAKASLINPIHP